LSCKASGKRKENDEHGIERSCHARQTCFGLKKKEEKLTFKFFLFFLNTKMMGLKFVLCK